jgi:endo-alpha-1,4-polygalactosaminidase (GH114 family)
MNNDLCFIKIENAARNILPLLAVVFGIAEKQCRNIRRKRRTLNGSNAVQQFIIVEEFVTQFTQCRVQLQCNPKKSKMSTIQFVRTLGSTVLDIGYAEE